MLHDIQMRPTNSVLNGLDCVYSRRFDAFVQLAVRLPGLSKVAYHVSPAEPDFP